MDAHYGAEVRSQRFGVVIHRGKLGLMMGEVSQLPANEKAKRLLLDALQALGSHNIDLAHRLAKDAIAADASTALFAGFLRSIVRFDNVDAYPGEPGYDEAHT